MHMSIFGRFSSTLVEVIASVIIPSIEIELKSENKKKQKKGRKSRVPLAFAVGCRCHN